MGEDRLTIDDCALNNASFLIHSHTLSDTPDTVNSVGQCYYREITQSGVFEEIGTDVLVVPTVSVFVVGVSTEGYVHFFVLFYIVSCININF